MNQFYGPFCTFSIYSIMPCRTHDSYMTSTWQLLHIQDDFLLMIYIKWQMFPYPYIWRLFMFVFYLCLFRILYRLCIWCIHHYVVNKDEYITTLWEKRLGILALSFVSPLFFTLYCCDWNVLPEAVVSQGLFPWCIHG